MAVFVDIAELLTIMCRICYTYIVVLDTARSGLKRGMPADDLGGEPNPADRSQLFS